MRRTKAEWTGIVERYRDSGLSVRRFCRTEGIVEQSLRNWIKRVMSRTEGAYGFVEVQACIATGSDGVEVPCLDSRDSRQGLTIRFGDDAVIEVHPDTNRNILEWVLPLMMRTRQ